jgi:hypothetical protein
MHQRAAPPQGSNVVPAPQRRTHPAEVTASPDILKYARVHQLQLLIPLSDPQLALLHALVARKSCTGPCSNGSFLRFPYMFVQRPVLVN